MPVDKKRENREDFKCTDYNSLTSVNLKTVDKVRDPITNRTSIHLGTGTIHIENFDANKDYSNSEFEDVGFIDFSCREEEPI